MFDTFSFSDINTFVDDDNTYIEQLLMKISDMESRETMREAHITDLENRLAIAEGKVRQMNETKDTSNNSEGYRLEKGNSLTDRVEKDRPNAPRPR